MTERTARAEAIEAAGTWLLRLPPYGSDFNPIEMAFSCPQGTRSIKLKAGLTR